MSTKTDPLEGYEPATRLTTALTTGLLRVWERLGCPEDCSVNTGWVMLDNIVELWAKYYPWELEGFIKDNKGSLLAERTVHEAVKQGGGHFPISFPTRLYQLIHTMLPNQNIRNKDFILKFARRYPDFKSTNAKI